MKLVFALLLVCTLGIGAIYAQTDGFTVVTTESGRRNSVASHPRALPDAALSFASGRQGRLLHILQSDGRVTIVDFIYTRCMSLCLAMGSEFQQLQAAIVAQHLEHRIRLLSISFDPTDKPEELARYARSQRADPRVWQFAMAVDAPERRKLLAGFGIVVIPAPLGQYVHNGAYHIVTADGHLARIIDVSDPQSVLGFARTQVLIDKREKTAAMAAVQP
ncbi:MAG: SCO family protein [Candidimonas sp.]|nr:MAG: SCO family protein [Candidimonas sp.]TAM21165.1 MAG: SCO family protein [Candidimonas sp.]TAM76610.1 MAG: SCO family protein [Candidimonas sp.]